MKVYYSPDYVAAADAFDTTRKSADIARSLVERPIAGVEIVEPVPLTAEFVSKIHDPAYVEAVRTGKPAELASSSGFRWDPGVWKAVMASNGGAVEAALEAFRTRGIAGSLSSGLHHAGYESGSGFCTFNGLVLAACAARKAGSANTLILDFDAHFGDGTADLIERECGIHMSDVSTSRLAPDEDYLEACRKRITRSQELWGPDLLVIYNAGMDPHEDCFLGGRKGVDETTLRQREVLVFETFARRGCPVAFVLAGGYANSRLTNPRLVDLHRLTIQAAVDASGMFPDSANR